MAQFNLRLGDDLLAALRRESKITDVPMNRIVLRTLEARFGVGRPTAASMVEVLKGPTGTPERPSIRQAEARVAEGVLRASEVRYRCPNDCDPGWRPASPSVRCPSCRKEVVPA